MKNKFKPIETFLIAHMMTFGIVLLLPNNTFDSPLYKNMAFIAKEEYWGILCVLIALFQLLSMMLDKKRMKIISLSATTFIWSSIGTMFLVEGITRGVFSTGVTYLVIAILSLWLSYKIGRQE